MVDGGSLEGAKADFENTLNEITNKYQKLESNYLGFLKGFVYFSNKGTLSKQLKKINELEKEAFSEVSDENESLEELGKRISARAFNQEIEKKILVIKQGAFGQKTSLIDEAIEKHDQIIHKESLEKFDSSKKEIEDFFNRFKGEIPNFRKEGLLDLISENIKKFNSKDPIANKFRGALLKDIFEKLVEHQGIGEVEEKLKKESPDFQGAIEWLEKTNGYLSEISKQLEEVVPEVANEVKANRNNALKEVASKIINSPPENLEEVDHWIDSSSKIIDILDDQGLKAEFRAQLEKQARKIQRNASIEIISHVENFLKDETVTIPKESYTQIFQILSKIENADRKFGGEGTPIAKLKKQFVEKLKERIQKIEEHKNKIETQKNTHEKEFKALDRTQTEEADKYIYSQGMLKSFLKNLDLPIVPKIKGKIENPFLETISIIRELVQLFPNVDAKQAKVFQELLNERGLITIEEATELLKPSELFERIAKYLETEKKSLNNMVKKAEKQQISVEKVCYELEEKLKQIDPVNQAEAHFLERAKQLRSAYTESSGEERSLKWEKYANFKTEKTTEAIEIKKYIRQMRQIQKDYQSYPSILENLNEIIQKLGMDDVNSQEVTYGRILSAFNESLKSPSLTDTVKSLVGIDNKEKREVVESASEWSSNAFVWIKQRDRVKKAGDFKGFLRNFLENQPLILKELEKNEGVLQKQAKENIKNNKLAEVYDHINWALEGIEKEKKAKKEAATLKIKLDQKSKEVKADTESIERLSNAVDQLNSIVIESQG